MKQLILAINPGSTSTKIAVYKGHKQLFVTTLRHDAKELSLYAKVSDQFQFRKDAIVKSLKDNDIDII